LRLGFITELLFKPIRYGYMNGIALAVLISQLPKLFAISIEEQGPLRYLVSLAQAIAAGKADWASFTVGTGSLMLILFLKRFEKIPQGLPAFGLPWASGADRAKIVLGGSAVALIAFAGTSVLSRTFAARANSWVDPYQEVRGYHDLERYPHGKRISGLVLFRWDAPLFFANAELFQERLSLAIAESPARVRRVVVAAEPVTSRAWT
jgi:MFS superfamily sulfate permease-like transporter